MDAMSAITEAPDYHDDSDAEDHIPEPPPGGPTCADCAVANAAVHCRDCDKPFCADCHKALHKKGKKKRHDALPIAAYLGAIPKPICADCEEDDSAVFCKACNKPFCDECSAALHRHGTKAAHERVHIITYLSALPPSARQANLPKKKPPAPKGPPPSKKKRGARASQSTSAGYGRQQQKQPQQRRASNRRSDSMRQPPPQQSFRGRPPPQQQQQQSFRGQPMPPQRQQQSFRDQPMPSQRQQQQQSTRQNRQQSQRGPPPGQRAPTGPPRSLAAALGASLDHVNDDNHGLKRVGGAPTSYKGAGDIASMMAAGRGKLNSTGMLDNLNEQGYVPGAVTASGVAGWDGEAAGGGDGGSNDGQAPFAGMKLNSTGMLDNLNEQGYVPGVVTAPGVASWGGEGEAAGDGYPEFVQPPLSAPPPLTEPPMPSMPPPAGGRGQLSSIAEDVDYNNGNAAQHGPSLSRGAGGFDEIIQPRESSIRPPPGSLAAMLKGALGVATAVHQEKVAGGYEPPEIGSAYKSGNQTNALVAGRQSLRHVDSALAPVGPAPGSMAEALASGRPALRHVELPSKDYD